MELHYRLPETETRCLWLIETRPWGLDGYDVDTITLVWRGRRSVVSRARFFAHLERWDALVAFWRWFDDAVGTALDREQSEYRAACGGRGWAPEGARDC